MWLAAGHYWPHFPVDCEGVVGPSEVDCCMHLKQRTVVKYSIWCIEIIQ